MYDVKGVRNVQLHMEKSALLPSHPFPTHRSTHTCSLFRPTSTPAPGGGLREEGTAVLHAAPGGRVSQTIWEDKEGMTRSNDGDG